MTNETILATDHINSKSDAGASSMTLSGQGANIDLDNTNDYQEEQPIYEDNEPKYTQGEYQTQINETNRKIEELNEWLDWVNEWYGEPSGSKEINKKYKELGNLLNLTNKQLTEIAATNTDMGKSHINSLINELLSKEYQKKEDILYNSEYDPRDYGERRKDSETERKVADYIAAGLNPAAVSGFYGGGGGGSGGGSAKEEDNERKKRRKRREEAAARKEAARQRNIDRALGVLSTIANVGGRLGGSLIMGNAWSKRANSQIESSNITAKNRLQVERLKHSLKNKRQASNEPEWLDNILEDIAKQDIKKF